MTALITTVFVASVLGSLPCAGMCGAFAAPAAGTASPVLGVVAREAVEPGCVVEVRAGESVPVDGVVVRGETLVDAAVLTGEPVRIAVGPGDAVSAVADVADAAARTRGNIRRCLAVSLAYNVAVAAVAMAAVVSPIIGAVLMPISSLTVLTIAVRSRSFEA